MALYGHWYSGYSGSFFASIRVIEHWVLLGSAMDFSAFRLVFYAFAIVPKIVDIE